jgi:hypothetical protein
MGLTSCSIINATSDMELNDCPRTNATSEPPPNEWTPVVGSKSQEVSDGSQSTSVVHG